MKAPRRPEAVSRRAESRAQLMAAAHELVELHAWGSLTIDVFTTAAALSRTAFYQHFQDREELLVAMLREIGPAIQRVGSGWMTGTTDDPVAELTHAFGVVTDLFIEHGRVLKAVSDLAAFDTRVNDAWQELIGLVVDATTTAIRRDVRAGRSDVRNARQLSLALSAMTRHYLLVSFGQRPLARRADVVQTMTRVWIQTLYGSLPASDG